MTAVGKVYKQANSLACIVPKFIVETLELRPGDYVIWDIEDGKAVVRKLER